MIRDCIILLLLFNGLNENCLSYATKQQCLWKEVLLQPTSPEAGPYCPQQLKNNTIYLLYDVNPPEGFNLRRDVYIRLATFVKQLKHNRRLFNNLKLVLPPWRRLLHWKSSRLQQDNLPWSSFFDVDSMRRYAPIMDFDEFLQEVSGFGLTESPNVPVHKTLQLLHFQEMFENGVFTDKYEFTPSDECIKEQYIKGPPLQQSILINKGFACVRFQGSAGLLEHVLRATLSEFDSKDPKVLVVLNAEIVLHEHWGDAEFWKARRSMRFAKHLEQEANYFRRTQMQCRDNDLSLQRPPMWENEKPSRGAVGCPYMCVHLRRGDFMYGRESRSPTLKAAAVQIKQQMKKLNLSSLFLASDASLFERQNLHSHLQRVHVVRYTAPDFEHKVFFKDGGIAIIDQILCSYAQYFMGTYESTFTYRIYEEREILGFSRDSTFNTICKDNNDEQCHKNSVWPIVY